MILVQLTCPTSMTMTAEPSATEKNMDLEPRVNRRRPFDLHWRKAPPAWQSNVEMAHRRLNPQQTAGDFCCAECGSRPCPFEHDDEGQKKSREVAFVGELVADRNSLRDQLNEVTIVTTIIRASGRRILTKGRITGADFSRGTT